MAIEGRNYCSFHLRNRISGGTVKRSMKKAPAKKAAKKAAKRK
jgi:hypothetical protein